MQRGRTLTQPSLDEAIMTLKHLLPVFAAALIGIATSPVHGTEVVTCNGFESCPTDDGDAIVALEARVAALEASTAGVPTGGIILWDSTTSCPAGYTAVATAFVGGSPLENHYLRATSGSGAGTVSGNSSVSPSLSATSTGTVGSTDLAHTHPVSGTVQGAGLHLHDFFSGFTENIAGAHREGEGPFTITGNHTHSGTTTTEGFHTHNFSATSGAAGVGMNHEHSVSISTTGSVTVGLAPLGYGVLMCRKT